MVESGRLTPALVSPEATAIGKHARDKADSNDPRPGEGEASLCVRPSVTAVGRSVDKVDVVMGKATAAFIHASDVQVAVGLVTSDLDIPNEWRRTGCRNL